MVVMLCEKVDGGFCSDGEEGGARNTERKGRDGED